MGRQSDLTPSLVGHWYRSHLTPLTAALTPLAWMFGIVVSARRALYRAGLLRSDGVPVPVVVVGNITAGGAGKTPVVIALAQALAARGFHPGVVSRGYGRTSPEATVVDASSPVREVGDEPLLMAQRGLRVAVGARRTEAARALLHAHKGCDVIIADDGLQHYALARDVEIAVIDGARGLGNRRLLPAGPLRETPARLSSVDAIVVNEPVEGVQTRFHASTFAVHVVAREFINVADASRTAALNAFAGQRVHAIAGIAHPARFFATLRALGAEPVTHAFPDHRTFTRDDLPEEASVILMTEKDAVKCAAFADARCWFLRIDAAVDQGLVDLVVARVRSAARAR